MPYHQGCIITAAVAAVGVVGGTYCVYHLYKTYQKPKLPTEWKEVGTLKDLYIYPIKSCGVVAMEKAECTLLGLRDGWLRDRVLMVVDEKDNFITARGYPELLKVEPVVRNCILNLSFPDMEPINVNLAEVAALGKPFTAQVWGIKVPVYDCGEEANKWFCRLLNRSDKQFRLVYYASEHCRQLKHLSENKFYKFTKNDTGAFGDEVSFHLINEASVEELNTRLKDSCKVSMPNFRPNFVVAGSNPFEEDEWKYIKIGENIFETIKPCLRCLMTTIDPETGVRNAKTEPLETLRTYRQIEDPAERRSAGTAPRMGLQIALRSAPGGIIARNDKVYVA